MSPRFVKDVSVSVIDFDNKFAAGVIDTGGAYITLRCRIDAKRIVRARWKIINEKTLSKKSCDVVSLIKFDKM